MWGLNERIWCLAHAKCSINICYDDDEDDRNDDVDEEEDKKRNVVTMNCSAVWPSLRVGGEKRGDVQRGFSRPEST